jgi:hypothetical protein
MKAFSALLLIVALALPAGAACAAADTKADDRKTVERKTIDYCPGGLERILPGEYYFCAAVRDFDHGHESRARERLRDAARWASKPAQYILGLTYFDGDQVPANRPLGVAWLALASERHDPRFEPAFAQAFLSLSPDEREKANTYWVSMKEEYADRVAGRRARRVYLEEMRNLQAASMFGGSIFIDGLTPPGMGASATGGQPQIFEGQSGFSVSRIINRSAEDLFHGMEGTVTVGEERRDLVPIGTLMNKPAAAKE